MSTPAAVNANEFRQAAFNAARPFSSFLPGIAGEFGKPLWAFYTNRGQCIASFGVGNRNGAMLEFHPANKAYVLTPLLGFRTFMGIAGGDALYEPFQAHGAQGVQQTLSIRPEELEIEEIHPHLGLRLRVAYFTLPHERLPALVRQVTVDNIGTRVVRAQVLDGLPQVVPYGLAELALKGMSRTMEAFAEILHVEDRLPFFKLKVEPSDKPDVTWINAGFFAFTLRGGESVPLVVDPGLVFGSDTSLRWPLAFMQGAPLDPLAARRETLTGSAFAQLALALEPGESARWDSFFGQAPDWEAARAFRDRAAGDAHYAGNKRRENAALIDGICGRFPLHAGPPQLDPYTRQSFLDNTMRGGQPVVVEGPDAPRVFHAFTRKHGDMERDYNFFEVAPTYWSQGNGNFRDVNQNRRSENFIYPQVGASNIDTFFNLIQLDGNNPLVIEFEKFRVPPSGWAPLLEAWPAGNAPAWQALLANPFSPGQLLEALVEAYGTEPVARPWFERILGVADKIQGAAHGEGYWVDHWIYCLDLLESYAALYPDRLGALLAGRDDFTYFDSDHVVQPRDRKYVLRGDGAVRQLHAVVRDAEKAALIAQRTEQPHMVRAGHGRGDIVRTTLLAKIFSLLAIKACLLDPSGIGLEMEAEKPGWCDALNGLPGLVGSSTHEAFALQRWMRFAARAVREHLPASGALSMPVEVARLLRSLAGVLEGADPADFLPTWQQLATLREAFRADVRLGVSGERADVAGSELLRFLAAADAVLARGLALAVDGAGLPVSYYINEVAEYDVLPAAAATSHTKGEAPPVHVRARRFVRRPVSAFLEGAVHALRSTDDAGRAASLYRAVRRSQLHDDKLGMYRINVSLQDESFEIGRSRIFSPGWLENESIFLHMHYKFLLETLRAGLAAEFFEDLRRGLVAFHDPQVYGRSPFENSSFIASSRFPDPQVHGTGFVARLSGASAEWISMVLHMGLGACPFEWVDGALRFTPRPTLADWLFTTRPEAGFGAGTFGFKLFGQTWLVYENPSRRATYGRDAVAPAAFELLYADGSRRVHSGAYLPEGMAHDLRDCKLAVLTIRLA